MHNKSGIKYIVLHNPLLKINGVWVEAVHYKTLDISGQTYVREKQDFLDKFTEAT
jgi:hypothetical protein